MRDAGENEAHSLLASIDAAENSWSSSSSFPFHLLVKHTILIKYEILLIDRCLLLCVVNSVSVLLISGKGMYIRLW